MELEVFRVGKAIDSLGIERNYSEADLDFIASTYNQRVATDVSEMAPIVKGHPKDNSPALGWTQYLKRTGEKLIAKVKDLSSEFKDELAAGRYRKVSISLYPDMMLRHIGFLGAAAPAVKNLKIAEFNELDTDEIEFSIDFAEKLMSESNDEKIKNLETELAKYKAKLGKYERESRISEYREYCNYAVARPECRHLAPVITEYLPEIMEMAHQLDQLNQNYSENNNSEMVKEFISSLGRTVNTNEFSSKIEIARELISPFVGKNVKPERIELHNRALEIMKNKPELSYEEAVLGIAG